MLQLIKSTIVRQKFQVNMIMTFRPYSVVLVSSSGLSQKISHYCGTEWPISIGEISKIH